MAQAIAQSTVINDDGWLDPQGKFYACGYAGHHDFALTQGKTVPQLEQSGWLHISGDYLCNLNMINPTQAQLDVLFDTLMALPDTYKAFQARRYFEAMQQND